MKHLRTGCLVVAILFPTAVWAVDATTPGSVSTPYPTLIHLSIDWPIQGDDNLNGVVGVEYRAAGSSVWREGLPLRRIPAGSAAGFAWGNKHSGSLFDLAPGTEYEIRLTLDDPDGGSTTRTVTARTRPVPVAAADATERPANPSTFDSVIASAQPGDIVLLAPGSYGAFRFPRDGTEGRPIVVRAAEPGTAVFNEELRLDNRRFVHLEGLAVNNRIRLNGTDGAVVRGCTINTGGDGVVASGGVGATNAYVADNTIVGSVDWSPSSIGAQGNNQGDGIKMTGPGNVIAYNYVRGFRDAISTLEDGGVVNQVSIDIYNNDVEVGADDAIEADFCQGNCRIVRNRITNSNTGLSSQPGLGGPTYFIRNVMYNLTHTPFKLHRRSHGDVALHNTSVKCGDAFAVYTGDTWSRAFFRNNLFIGGAGDAACRGETRITHLIAADATCDFDYDGYGAIGAGFAGRIGPTRYGNLAEMQSRTTEVHAVELDMSVFSPSVSYPDDPFPAWSIPDLSVVAGSDAVDRGVALPGINDGYSGSAPDLGAVEVGSTPVHYGPRDGGPSDPPPPPPPGDPPPPPQNLRVIRR